MNGCVVCGWSPIKANWRCSACNGYLERTGTDRPEHLLDRQLVRRVSRCTCTAVVQPS